MCSSYVCCRVLQGVAGCCRVLRGVAVCCRVLRGFLSARNLVGFGQNTLAFSKITTQKCCKNDQAHFAQAQLCLTPSTALNFVHRNSFPKLPNFHNVLLNFANFRGRPISKSMQIPKKRIETVGIHVQTVGTC